MPWTEDIQVIYEHYHRYSFALRFAKGARVLDLASGEGYGAALLAGVAAEVVGLEIDAETVAHARSWYRDKNLRFVQGSMTDPDALADEAPFDVITCFEAIEHVDEQDQTMQLVRNRLAPGGVFLCSTPDVAVYTHDHGNDNPFHVHELSEDEFRALLAGSFANVELCRQSVAMGSLIHDGSTSGPVHTEQLIRRSAQEWRIQDGAPHTYLLAIASDSRIEAPGTSVLVDDKLTMLRSAVEAEQARGRESARELSVRMDAAEQAHRTNVERFQAELEQAQELARNQLAALAQERDRLHEDAARLSAEAEQQRRRAEREAQRVGWMTEQRAQLMSRVDRLAAENAELRVEQSSSAQQLLRRYRDGVERLAPRGSRRRNAYERALGRSAVPAAEQAAAPGPVAVSTSEQPMASVVVPAYDKWELTRGCLASIQQHLPATPFEVIVVDDASPDDAADRVAECPGVRLVRAERNLGFVGACNLGAEHARGELVMFLNNDTEVRAGWLDALVEVLETRPDVGLVGAKLVYPDGRLQECGGIIWSDGTGWNYGRGGDPNAPEHRTLRDVDYCSGAALMVRRSLFEQIGGFDSRYAPAYYEDTDLAFAVRAAGYRTLVQPESLVVHIEGASNGTDVAAGVKRHQEINRAIFVEKWAGKLAAHFSEPSAGNLWSARHRTADGHGGGIVLVADHEVPRADRDSGSVRMARILKALTDLGQRVVFFPMNGALPEAHTSWLHRIGVTVVAGEERQGAFLVDAGPHLKVALLSRPQVAWRLLEPIRAYASRCLVAYDTVDLHFLRLQRQAEIAATNNADDESALRGQAQALRELELGLVRATDLTLTVSDVEQRLLRDLVPGARVEVVSNIHEVMPGTADPIGRSGILFVGGFDHIPNRDAAQWLCSEIMPLVWRRRPDAVVHIVGSNPPAEVTELAHDGVEVHGWVSELEPVYQRSRVVVAPLRFGAGVKGKVGEALACGVPVVATSIAAEGMHVVDGEHVLIADTPKALADGLLRLLDDDDLWARCSAAGKAAVGAQFGVQRARDALSDLLAAATRV